MTPRTPALLDTDVFSLLYVRRNATDGRVAGWRESLIGRRVLISFQTRAEILAGAVSNGWGERRMTDLRAILDRTPTVGIDYSVVDTHADLYAACRRAGHPLHGKIHTGDRWVAACAIDKGLELLAGDSIFDGAPGVTMLEHR